MRSLYRFLLAIFAGTVMVSTPAMAASSVLLNGQTHYYTVQMRNDRQTITYAKIILKAPQNEELKRYTFSLPEGVSATNLSIQQLRAKVSSQPCTNYEPIADWLKRQPITSSPSSYETTKRCLTYNASATDENYDYEKPMYDSTDYYGTQYYSSRLDNYTYTDIQPEHKGQTYTLTLPAPIQPQKQGALLVSYTSKDHIKGQFGVYTYNYRTLTTEQMIDRATVVINFDEDLYARQASQKRLSDTPLKAASGTEYTSPANAQNNRSVEQGGRIVKTQSKLLPGDTVSINGTFATERLLLYGQEFLIGLLMLMITLFVVRRLYIQRRSSIKGKGRTGKKSSAAETPLWKRSLDGTVVTTDGLSVRRMFGVSLLSIAITTVSTLIVGTLAREMAYSDIGTTILMPIAIIMIVLLAGIVIPLFYIAQFGMHRAWRWAILHLILVMIALGIFALAANLIGSESSPIPYLN